jgi:hypothetical protein
VKTKNKGDVGAVGRSHDGVYLGASVVVFEGVTDPGCLQAMACREAHALAADLLVGNITMGLDCLDVVKGLHGQHLGVYSHILLKIKKIADRHREAMKGRRSDQIGLSE